MMTSASKIMVIRHAEKPDQENASPYGVDSKGVQNFECLLVDGWQRAGAITCLFAPARGSLQSALLATPQVLFATGEAKHSESKRPHETIKPLSQKLNLPINADFLKDDYSNMVNAVMASAGVVLIAWQHQDIPAIANQILGNSSAPQKWPGDRFDMVWVFDWNDSNQA
ncbi:MAG: hypothetical protein K2P84_11985, partial [Undibacterium sp.]|nr:hypothetical protein [Undibacterium sp.]